MITGRLPQIDVPTLVTGGRYDEARPEHLQLLKEGIPAAELLIFEKSSHMAFVEEPQHYIAAIAAFLARVERTAADHCQSPRGG